MYLDPYEPVDAKRRKLPHWRQDGAIYFVTFRTADSIPLELMGGWRDEREAWLKHHHEPFSREEAQEYHDRFSLKMNQWLDAGMGECPMRTFGASQIVAKALEFFEGERYELGEWVVMPNHVHVVCRPMEGFDLSEILHSWKSFTANRINKLLGMTGALWRDESYDQILRSEEHLSNVEEYIRMNPGKSGIRVHHASFIGVD